ncbi:MAG: hypothetical protein ACRDKS_02870, partial [Actinomycetota bacterium]
MSIYATLWKLKFPKDGDEYPGCEWITVIAQGVPAHVGSQENGSRGADPFAAFLPALSSTCADRDDALRAVVFVTEGTPKGTARSAQEYVDPLLVLTGEAYASMPFEALYSRICDALRGNKPRLLAAFVLPEGRVR